MSRAGQDGETEARLEARDGSFFGGEAALLPTLCKQVGPRKLWVLLCTVWFHTYSLRF